MTRIVARTFNKFVTIEWTTYNRITQLQTRFFFISKLQNKLEYFKFIVSFFFGIYLIIRKLFFFGGKIWRILFNCDTLCAGWGVNCDGYWRIHMRLSSRNSREVITVAKLCWFGQDAGAMRNKKYASNRNLKWWFSQFKTKINFNVQQIRKKKFSCYSFFHSLFSFFYKVVTFIYIKKWKKSIVFWRK